MKRRTIISTLRHAHTDYNAEKRYAGTIDIGLSSTGKKQARAFSDAMVKGKYDIVITSNLRRSYETAKTMLDGTVPIVKNPLCNERNYGILEGLTWNDVTNLKPPVMMIEVGNDLHTVNPKGGEPFEDLWKRAQKFHRYVMREHGGKNILIVSHGVFLQMYHGILRGLSCIESLAEYPGNMELNKFYLSGTIMVKEEKIALGSYENNKW